MIESLPASYSALESEPEILQYVLYQILQPLITDGSITMYFQELKELCINYMYDKTDEGHMMDLDQELYMKDQAFLLASLVTHFDAYQKKIVLSNLFLGIRFFK
ncbi:hypothetical protein NC661_20895 [Aquibacillus koreensis]|uniref:Uncharacterized protein n=1 Tax=Aquibacillus koreensis TaxID=279446 RepID=A0A9X3WSU8_9BACI|nr:hypothetical protein [Aquibacillus koreensis]MCT2536090.1 hypothetical protein [Aquibacillus koreensis]MDC3422804.1 hypothetical protein [Aquibacillus koreensis]